MPPCNSDFSYCPSVHIYREGFEPSHDISAVHSRTQATNTYKGAFTSQKQFYYSLKPRSNASRVAPLGIVMGACFFLIKRGGRARGRNLLGGWVALRGNLFKHTFLAINRYYTSDTGLCRELTLIIDKLYTRFKIM